MATDTLPGEIVAKSRDEWITSYLRSYRFRDPDALTVEGTQPYIDACSMADQLAVLSASARQIGRKIPLADLVGEEVDIRAAEVGIPPRYPDSGASGYVIARTSIAGSTILAGDELSDDATGSRFQCTQTQLYHDGVGIPIIGISTGSSTNLPAGTVLRWGAPRPGSFPTAVVSEQPDGSGLSGGRLGETDDEVKLRISDAMANPAASGNDAEYQRLAEDARGHGVPVSKAFTYPAILGSGTTGLAFTLRPGAPGTTRRPNLAQMQQVYDYVVGKVPGDDSVFSIALVAQPEDIIIDLQWAAGAGDWVNAVPWPVRYATGVGKVVVASVTSETSFVLMRDNLSYTGIAHPVAGNVIALYDRGAGVFRRKRILSVVGTGPWAITVDTTNNASDTSYLPVMGQPVCPWSDSLDTIVPTILDYFTTLGPGEQRATFFDPGVRERRSPASPKYWPHVIGNRLAADLLQMPSLHDAVIREGLGRATNVGTAGAFSFLIELGYIAAFPL